MLAPVANGDEHEVGSYRRRLPHRLEIRTAIPANYISDIRLDTQALDARHWGRASGLPWGRASGLPCETSSKRFYNRDPYADPRRLDLTIPTPIYTSRRRRAKATSHRAAEACSAVNGFILGTSCWIIKVIIISHNWLCYCVSSQGHH